MSDSGHFYNDSKIINIIINDMERLLNIDILLTVIGIRRLHDGDNTILIIILLYFIEYWYSVKSLLVFYLWYT